MLRKRAVLAQSFAIPVRSLLALLYGISPSVGITIDAERISFRLSRAGAPWIPLPRITRGSRYIAMPECALNQAFAAHAQRSRAACTIYDLLADSSRVAHVAQVGELLRQAVARGEEELTPLAAQSVADKMDFVLLLLIGDTLSPSYQSIHIALHAIQETGDGANSRAQWISALVRKIGWRNLTGECLVPILDEVFSPIRSLPSHQRMAARSCIARVLHGDA
jgi:hypothetical protein